MLILRGVRSGREGRDPEAGNAVKGEERVGGEYAWGLYPFCSVGLSVSNMGATWDFRQITLWVCGEGWGGGKLRTRGRGGGSGVGRSERVEVCSRR